MQGCQKSDQTGVFIENLSWDEAEKHLTPGAVVVIPLGARTKEHGYHLPLNNDWIMANYLTERLAVKLPVVIFPTIQYHYFPAFKEYPGSVSLSLETSTNMVIEIVESIAKYGVKKFYILNTGISTLKPLKLAATKLRQSGLYLNYTNLKKDLGGLEQSLKTQKHGTHADELETSKMLYMAKDIVRMDRAVANDVPNVPGPLTRDPNNKEGLYSKSGVWGDPTKADVKKGEKLTEHLVKTVIHQVWELVRQTPEQLLADN